MGLVDKGQTLRVAAAVVVAALPRGFALGDHEQQQDRE